MSAVDLFVDGKISLEDAVLSSDSREAASIFLALTWDQIVLGVRERDAAPMFTCVPVGLRAGFGVGADRVFQALDGMPMGHRAGKAKEVMGARQLPPEVRPGLVSALAELVREGGTYADR